MTCRVLRAFALPPVAAPELFCHLATRRSHPSTMWLTLKRLALGVALIVLVSGVLLVSDINARYRSARHFA